MNTKVTIKQFDQMLHAENQGSALMEALRKLTEVKDTASFSAKEPSPLGAWGGWGVY